MRRKLSMVLISVLAPLACAPTAAHAAFPGQNGQIGFSTGPTEDLFAIDFDGRNARSLIVRPGSDVAPSWSPDGKQVAWNNNASGRSQIYVAGADGSNVRRFAPSSGYDYRQSWSPDGRHLLFLSGRDGTGTTELYVADAPGGTNVRRLTYRPLEDAGAVWSPDGTTIVWSSRESATEKFHLYVMNADGSNQRRLTTRTPREGEPAWSPDGRRLLWTSYSGGGEIWVANADGSAPQRIYSTPYLLYSPAWSPDGRLIAFTQRRGNGDDRPFDIWVMGADGTNPSLVIGIGKSGRGVSLDWQPFADRGAQPASLLRDGGAEDAFGGYFTSVAYLIEKWQTNGGMSVLRYGLPGYPSAASLPPTLGVAAQRDIGGVRGPDGGKRFFFGGAQEVSTAVQDVDLGAQANEIDTGRASVTLSGLLGGKGTETDEGTVVGTFLDGQGKPLGLVQIGPVTPADRGNATTFVGRMETTPLPAGTRTVRVTLTATRRVAPINDSYFDNLALLYTKPGETPPEKPPEPVKPDEQPVPPGTVGGAGGPAGNPGLPGAGRLRDLTITPSRFAVARRDTAIVAARTQRGARIRYRVPRAGLVTFDVLRPRAGRRSATGRCVAPTPANQGRRRCRRLVSVATILRRNREGRNTVRFSGRVRGRPLARGRYRLRASMTDLAGRNLKPVSVRFRIVRG